VGYDEKEDIIPYPDNAFHGYRLLQEYFALPQKFHFFEVSGLSALSSLPSATAFEIRFEFNKPFDDKIRIDTGNILLYCTPIMNIFDRDADPIRIDHKKLEYVVRPSSGSMSHYEIFSINSVLGWVQGSGEKRKYQPFLSYDHGTDKKGSEEVYYKVKVAPSVVSRGLDTIISFVNSGDEHALPKTETVSLELSCTNRHLAEKLRVGDISRATSSSPEVAKFENIISPTPSVPPPVGKGLHWLLISNMSLNYSSLASVEALRLILSTYNFNAHYDEQQKRVNELRMEGIEEVNVSPVTFLLKGAPMRGVSTKLNLRSSKFGGDGEMYLFASILNEFFALYSSINSFNQLVLRNVERGEEYRWKPRLGRQPLL
jgi:type VI secretion system protein ImpG